VRLATWTWRIGAKCPSNEAVVEAREMAENLARFVGCPFHFVPDSNSQRTSAAPSEPGED
jgi:hypothetical protein